MKFFKNIQTIEALKVEYRKLAFLHHPDRGGNVEVMKMVNAEYDEVLKNLANTANEEVNEMEFAENFKEVIDRLMKCDGLEIEICGSWLWVTGATKLYVDLFKELGFRWRSKKLAWSLGDSAKKHKGETSMDQIRGTYGSQIIKSSGHSVLG